MRKYRFRPLACCLFFAVCASAAPVRGNVTDPSGAPVPGAKVSIVNRTGVAIQTTTNGAGAFEVDVPEVSGFNVVVTASGFSTRSLPLAAVIDVSLEIAPVEDAVSVVGSAIDVSPTRQGGSVSIIGNADVRRRNEPFALDLLRYIPGMAFNQTGATGGVTSLFLRGGYSGFNLVQVDGVTVNAFGGAFDFGHLPTFALDHIEVIRGAQSAVYGSYANSGVINFVTRRPEGAPQLELLAEGGSYDEHRFGIAATGVIGGFGIAASASRLDTNGVVANNDYRNEDALLTIGRRFGRHDFTAHGYFDANEVGQPGAWGSDPKHTFTGINTVSRGKNNTSSYLGRYEAALTDRLRQEVSASFFLNNNGFRSRSGFSFNKDIRGQAESRTIISVTRYYTAAVGVSVGREEVRNTFITDASRQGFLLRRNDVAVYAENRFVAGGRLFLNAGVRGEFFRTPQIPPDGFSRPLLPESSISRANPKISAAFLATPSTRIHSSFGTGIRPPSGFDLAFTNNPVLEPERTRSVDAGVEQKLFHNVLLLDGTFFYNRYYDLIVTLGGSLTSLSRYQSANLANSRAYGLELTAGLRPSRHVFINGTYTALSTRILSLDGSSTLAPRPFAVGQPLTRRPENSGSLVSAYTRGRLSADITGYFRGKTLFEEPALGATNGLFWSAGYANFGLNLGYAVSRGVTVYGHLRNALNRHYEEVFGFPSPRINFVTGVKWTLSRRP